MVSRIPPQYLVNALLAGAIGTVGMAFLARRKMYEVTMNSEPYRNAVDALKRHNGAQYILGTPIEDKRYDIFNRKSDLIKNLDCKFKMHVSGPEGAGYYYFYGERPDQRSPWKLTQCELEVRETTKLEKEEYEEKRLIIYSLARDGPLKTDEVTDGGVEASSS